MFFNVHLKQISTKVNMNLESLRKICNFLPRLSLVQQNMFFLQNPEQGMSCLNL